MKNETNSCPRCTVALRAIDVDGIVVEFCSVCRGGFTSQDTLDRLLGHGLDGADQGPTGLGDMDECVSCGAPVIRNEHPQNTWFSCAACDGAWLEAGVMARVHGERSSAPPSQNAPSAGPTEPSITANPEVAELPAPSSTLGPRRSLGHPVTELLALGSDDEAGLLSSRLPFDLPLVQYLSLPAAAVVGLLLG
ncbi:MAG: zf-TFIIB domain-containing protein, partial [Deltaproteobacteria bacterium]|nr:zf-TFIIB domain-containing protein [Deltaproteobacteria bacterium]